MKEGKEEWRQEDEGGEGEKSDLFAFDLILFL